MSVSEGEGVIERLRARLAARAPARIELDGFRPAAVLVPLVGRGAAPEELRLIFTLRHHDLRSHSGQISFPGGKVDAGDADRAATALREADEELGIPPRAVRVLGELDDVPTPTGFVITPVVGWIAEAPPLRPNPVEVAEAFEVPLARLRAPGVFEAQGEVERWGRTYQLVAYKVDGRNIWGATARMLWMLLRELA